MGVKRSLPNLNINPKPKRTKRLISRKIIYYPNRLNDLYISNFKQNQIVYLPQTKSNQSINEECMKSSKSTTNNRLGPLNNQLSHMFFKFLLPIFFVPNIQVFCEVFTCLNTQKQRCK